MIPGAADQWLVDELFDEPDLLDPAEVSGVIIVEADTVRFHHELARRAVWEAVPSARRRRLHGSVGTALETAGADHSMIVHHAIAARDSAMVMRHVESAIDEAIYSGSSTQALELVSVLDEHQRPSNPKVQGWAEIQRANALLALDRGEEALDAARRAVELLRPLGAGFTLAEAYRSLGRIAWWLRDLDASRPAANEALAVLDQLPNDEETAVVRSRLAHLLALARDPRAAETAQRALELARAAGSGRAVASADVALGLSGGMEELATHMMRAIEEARSVGDAETETRATANLASAYAHAHRYDEAEQWLPRAEQLARDNEQLAALSVAAGLRPWIQAARGDLVGAIGGFDAYITEIENPNQQAWGHLHKGIVLARLGDMDAAVELIESARGSRAGRSANPELVFEAARVEVWWLAGREFDGDRTIVEVLWPNRHDRPEDYVARLARNLVRAGFDVPRFELGLAGFTEAIWGDPAAAARIWEEVGNPYEQGVELSLAGHDTGRQILEAISAFGALRRIFGG